MMVVMKQAPEPALRFVEQEKVRQKTEKDQQKQQKRRKVAGGGGGPRLKPGQTLQITIANDLFQGEEEGEEDKSGIADILRLIDGQT